MPRTRSKKQGAHDTATRVAEGIGEALARIVNRLESLDAERDRVYKQLLALQDRVNPQTASRRTTKKKTRSKTRRPRKKAQIKCGICGTPGHNARGHAKWKASRAK